MHLFRLLQSFVVSMPAWAQILIAVVLVAFTLVSVYGRVNTSFGARIFSNVPENRLRTDPGHLFWYTVIPALACIGYTSMLVV